jgi:hypothetical protein
MKKFVLLFLIFFSSCKKEGEPRFCWQLVDNLGNEMGTECNKTEAEIAATYSNPCSYYKVDGPEFCWFINNQTFVKNKTENWVQHFTQCSGGGTAMKVNCNYCSDYYTRSKYTYKPNNSFFYSQVSFQKFCGDTVATLYHGRQIIIKDTPDSLIVVQFSTTGIF